MVRKKNTKSIKVSDFVHVSFTLLLQIFHASIFNIEWEKRRKATLKRQKLNMSSRSYRKQHNFYFSSERKFCLNEHHFQKLFLCKRVIRKMENAPTEFRLEII